MSEELTKTLAAKLSALGPVGKAALATELRVAGIAKVEDCPADQLEYLVDGLQNQYDMLSTQCPIQ